MIQRPRLRYSLLCSLALGSGIGWLAACHDAGSAGTARAQAPARAGTAQVDSARAPAEALRRFQAAVVDTPSTLAGGAPSREALVAAFGRAVAAHDTAALRRLHVDRGEFAFLYYPDSEHSRRPLYQPPEVLWLRYGMASEKGIVRVLRRLGGEPLGIVAHGCRGVTAEGRHRLHHDCRVRRVVAGDTVEQRLFGSILERDGRFKFLTYSNDF